MPVITRFEHQAIPINGIEGLTDEHVDKLERLNSKFDNKLLEIGRHQVRTTGYVGIVRAGNLTIQILPKIDRDDSEIGATRNLLHMLTYSSNLKITPQQAASLAHGKTEWLEFLTSFYATELLRLLQQGVQRNYITIDETLPVMRGRWNIPSQLTKRPHIQHLFDLTYDEFSDDNPLNRVFLFVTSRLENITNLQENRRKLRQIRLILSNVSLPASISAQDLQKIHFNRLNQQYQAVFNLAQLFIQHYTPQLLIGQQDVYAFVFRMFDLFETFVAEFIKQHRQNIIPSDWQILTQYRQNKLAYRIKDGRTVEQFTLEPDILLKDIEGKVHTVVDTKYKSIDPLNNNLNISRDDVYQMLAYATRFQCRHIVLLYPQPIAEFQPIRYHIYNTDVTVTVGTINLKQPLDLIESKQSICQALHQLLISKDIQDAPI